MRHAMMDMEFEKVKDIDPLVEVNTTAPREHMGLIERKIRQVKKKVRATTSEFSLLVLIQTVYSCAFWINTFPNHSRNFRFSSRDKVTGLSMDYGRDCKVNIGSYVEACVDAIVTNNNTKRTRSCAALGPIGNRQGPIKCFDIESGKILHCRAMTQLLWPLDNRLVRKVEAWNKKGARAIKKSCIEFLNRKN